MKLGKNYAKTFQLLKQACGDARSCTLCHERFSRFKSVRQSNEVLLLQLMTSIFRKWTIRCCKSLFDCQRTCIRGLHLDWTKPWNFDWKIEQFVRFVPDEQPPYSPDLAPCNFFLFPKLKSMLKVLFSEHWWHQSKRPSQMKLFGTASHNENNAVKSVWVGYFEGILVRAGDTLYRSVYM